MSARLVYPVFDADNHMYETQDAFTRYLPAKYDGLIRYVQVNGRTKIAVGGLISDYIPNPTFEVVAKPGAHNDYFSGNNPEGRTLRQITGEPMRAIPAFRAAAPRLELLDELGIDASLMFPTLASLLEVRMMDDPELTEDVIHALNQWMQDEWTFDYQGRIFATPVVNPAVVDLGVSELEWVLDRGARVVQLRPAPVAGHKGPRSPFLPEFDPFWARVEESGVLVALHGSDSGYQRYANDWNGQTGEFLAFKPTPFSAASTEGRAISDTIYSAICHGMLSRFPGVKLASIENGGGWTLPVLKTLEHVYRKMPQEFAEHPREVFLRNIWVNPFWEDSVTELIHEIGADHVLFGSDYPHPEGLADPASYVDELEGLPDETVRKIMGGNLAHLMKVGDAILR
jgi:predicted TIM-barrel fold metal-dependent hydrolase